jgi:hypothetical protein
VVFGIDGLERSYVEARIAEGALPAFARLWSEGTVSDLATLTPSESPAIWTTLASGYPPEQHGVTGWTLADGRVPSGADVRTDRIWNRASDDDRTVVVSGWLMTSPAEQVQGALVSERLVWQRTPDRYDPTTLVPGDLVKRRLDGATWPPDLVDPVRDLIPHRKWLSRHRLGWQLDALGRGHHPLPSDETHLRAFEQLFDPLEAQLGAVYWMGVDQLSHLYWPFVVPQAIATLTADPDARRRAYAGNPASRQEGEDKKFFPWVDASMTPAQLSEGQRWIEDAYAAADDALARVMAQVDPATTTLVLLSDHGFEGGDTLPVLDARHRDVGLIAGWGLRARSGAVGARPPQLVDVTPTLCALLGLDAGRDMTGRPLIELFDIEPPDRGGSWLRPASETPAQPVPPALQDQLESLGYVE